MGEIKITITQKNGKFDVIIIRRYSLDRNSSSSNIFSLAIMSPINEFHKMNSLQEKAIIAPEKKGFNIFGVNIKMPWTSGNEDPSPKPDNQQMEPIKMTPTNISKSTPYRKPLIRQDSDDIFNENQVIFYKTEF